MLFTVGYRGGRMVIQRSKIIDSGLPLLSAILRQHKLIRLSGLLE